MRKAFILTVGILWCAIAVAAEVDPADALARAKKHIAANQHKQAVALLEPALVSAGRISDAAQRTQALAALHFYAGLAYFGSRDTESAGAHLTEFFRLSPSTHRLDPKRYDAAFIELFDAAAAEAKSSGDFRELYGNFHTFEAPAATHPSDAFGSNPALEILGTTKEKREWQSLVAAADRERFIADFWQRRDTSPNTPANEFRDSFARRVAFADEVFALPGERGSLTDRGRVFVLLSEPSLVRRRALDSSDTIRAMNVGSLGIETGTIEYWFYTRDQLPTALAKPNITFRFVTHQGVGQHILQKDGLSMNTLALAANASAGEKKRD